MPEGYLICRVKAEGVGEYDAEISKILGLHVFWVDAEITQKRMEEIERKCEGKLFKLDEIIFTGLKDLADKLGFQKYLKDRDKKPTYIG
jgi:hypothetical protein